MECGKRTICFLRVPLKRATDNLENYQYCTRTIIQRYFQLILRLINKYRHGFMLPLPGSIELAHITPRVGLFFTDLLEARKLALTSGSASVRCDATLQPWDSDCASDSDGHHGPVS
jgi:hypothetical protein